MASIGNITFACEDPERMASFWATAIGYEVEPAPPDLIEALEAEETDMNLAAAAVDPSGEGPRLFFTKRPCSSPYDLPIHLDITVEDREGAVERLSSTGAEYVDSTTELTGPYSATWSVMRDPEGNGFCVQSPEEG